MRKIDDDDECTCAEQCPGSNSCACIYIIDEAQCVCKCTATAEPGGGVAFLRGRALSLDAHVNVSINQVELGQLGELLSGLCEPELAIPASICRKKVSFTQKNTTVADVVKRAGLLVLTKEPISE